MTPVSAMLCRTLLGTYAQLYRLQEAEIEFAAGLAGWISRNRPGWSGRPVIGIDVGSNTGSFALVMSRVCTAVLAIEPNPRASALLARAGLPHVTLARVAASNRAGSAILRDAAPGGWRHPTASLVAHEEATAAWALACRTERIDSLAKRHLPDHGAGVLVVKIDVEGHEKEALEGMGRLLGHPRAIIIIELQDYGTGHHVEASRMLEAAGFACCRYAHGTLETATLAEVPRTGAGLDGRFARLRGKSSNFVFVKPA